MLFNPDTDTGLDSSMCGITIGNKVGHPPSIFSAGVFTVQRSRGFRRRGDAMGQLKPGPTEIQV